MSASIAQRSGLPFGGLFDLWRQEFRGYLLSTLRADVLAGLTVVAVALPLALAFGAPRVRPPPRDW